LQHHYWRYGLEDKSLSTDAQIIRTSGTTQPVVECFSQSLFEIKLRGMSVINDQTKNSWTS